MEEGEQSVEELAAPEVIDTQEDDGITTDTIAEEIPPGEDEIPPPEEDDSEEIEHAGERYKIPKALKEAFLRQEDYTRKTQEVAEARKALETQQAELYQRAQFHQAHLQDIAQLTQLEQQLTQFNNLNWSELIDNDPVTAMKYQQQHQALRDAYQGTYTKIQQAQQQQALEMQRNDAKLIEQSREVLARELKDWTPEVGPEIRNYLKGYEHLGVTESMLNDINLGRQGPLPIILARKAQLYDQMILKASQKPPQAPPPKPVTKVGGTTSAAKDPVDMSPKEFAAWRAKQIKNRS